MLVYGSFLLCNKIGRVTIRVIMIPMTKMPFVEPISLVVPKGLAGVAVCCMETAVPLWEASAVRLKLWIANNKSKAMIKKETNPSIRVVFMVPSL